MKKIIVLALTVFCMLGVMAACGSSADTEAVEQKLNNSTWVSSGQDYATGQDFTTTWTFTDGKVSAENVFGTEEFAPDTGAYKVNDNGSVSLTWDVADNNRITELYFDYENDELKLYMDKEKEAALTRQ